ncbi:MAG: dihydrofolate reductase family protein [Jatrophihabitantaceae bacterium]
MRQLLPAPNQHPAEPIAVDVHQHYAAGWLDGGGVRVNFVSSVDGAATLRGLSRGLQTPGDNTVFAALRDLADVILVGAATAAAEGYRPSNPSARRRELRTAHGLAPAPAIAVMSASLALDLSMPLFTTATEAPTLVITGSAAPVSRRNDIIDIAGGPAKLQLVEAPSDRSGGVDFATAIESLRNLGYRRVLCEGGPRLFGAGVAAGAVDELCMSYSPLLAGPAGDRIIGGSDWPAELAPRLSLIGLLTEDDALFCRYRVQR